MQSPNKVELELTSPGHPDGSLLHVDNFFFPQDFERERKNEHMHAHLNRGGRERGEKGLSTEQGVFIQP